MTQERSDEFLKKNNEILTFEAQFVTEVFCVDITAQVWIFLEFKALLIGVKWALKTDDVRIFVISCCILIS